MPIRIEINFPFDVEVPDKVFMKIDDLITKEVCERYKENHPDRTMWVSGHGSKMFCSSVDSQILGSEVEIDFNIKDGADPRFDDSIYEITITERGK